MGDSIAATGASELKPDVSSFLCEVIGARLGCSHWRTTEPPETTAWGQPTLVIYKLTSKLVPSKIPWEGSNVHLHALKAQYDESLTHAKVVAATGASNDVATPCASKEEETKHALAAAPASLAATGAESANDATSAAEPAKTTPLAATGDDASEPQDDRLLLGAIVLFTVSKHKGKQNGF